MPNLFTVPAGVAIARQSAAHLLATLSGEALARALILLPNRRSCVVMRDAFQQQLGGKAALLPRMVPLAEIDTVLVGMLGAAALPLLQTIPPAMPPHQQRYLLTEQIRAFERKRMERMGGVSLHYALTLADALIALQEQCARAQVVLTHEKLRALVHANFATHYEQSLLFLGILTEHWPTIERAFGCIIAPAREVALLNLLAEHWVNHPSEHAVIAIGSTASQPATARLLKVIADMEHGQVILPALDPDIAADEWAQIVAGHPLFHIKALLDQWPVGPSAVAPLHPGTRSVWMDALAPMARFVQGQSAYSPLEGESNRPLSDSVGGNATKESPHQSSQENFGSPSRGEQGAYISLIACAHAEEEARVISLLLREALEDAGKRVALITPDEGLMARVAAHMLRYGIHADRLNAGTLAATQTGNLWAALLASITEPTRQLALRSLLHHPLLAVDPALLRGLEKGWHGVSRTRVGQLPRHDAGLTEHAEYGALSQFVRGLAQLSTQRMAASAWVVACNALLTAINAQAGQGQDSVAEQLDALAEADSFGTVDAEDFAALLAERLATPWRDAGLRTQPNLFMLTPVEARLEQFDRTILANMQEAMWPGAAAPNPWLNLAAQAALGLPAPEEHISRMAHDVLALASGGEVFLTYPLRDAGSPTTRSRFIERLVTLLAMRGVDARRLDAPQYIAWAHALDASDAYAPEAPARPMPTSAQRPRRLPVTDLDKLFTDPFTIYARHVLGLRTLEEIDATLEASDFGSLAHKAIEALTMHWNTHARPADAAELAAMAQHSLREFSSAPNVDLFWRARLLGALAYVNGLEQTRRSVPMVVATEQVLEGALALAGGEQMLLHGRIDRLEMRDGCATIIDHKTGNAPSAKKIVEGRALQLLAYAMMLGKTGIATQAVEYWAMPKLGDEGAITGVAAAEIDLGAIEASLCAALTQMLDANTPFLAHPVGNDDHFGNDYDGISRYDEWAG